MKLKSQVCSSELAQRLKELGVKQESYFYYGRETSDCIWTQDNYQLILNPISAFTVAELGEMLPDCIKDRNGDILFEEMDRDKSDSVYFYNYVHLDDTEDEKAESKLLVSSDTEADARAKMLIYLLENKLITL
jgi:hypothetical protein